MADAGSIVGQESLIFGHMGSRNRSREEGHGQRLFPLRRDFCLIPDQSILLPID